jgi:Rod binding domain-containing protein
MTLMTIGSLTPAQQKPDVATPSEPTAEQKKAARDFEAIFMRQLLSSLEKGSGLTGGDSGGGAVFRSMMVGALADTAAEGGGIGLSELILKAMMPPAPQGKPDLSHQDRPDPISQKGASAGGGLTEARPATILDGNQSTSTTPPLSARGVR